MGRENSRFTGGPEVGILRDRIKSGALFFFININKKNC